MRKTYSTLIYSAFILALIVIVLGSFTRLTDSGLGCPDWPGCYGNLAVPEQVDTDKYDRPLVPHQAWNEMIHRYVAGTLGILILIIFLYALKNRRQLDQGLGLPSVLLGTVIFQALLGMWTVTELLTPTIVTAHLLGGFTTLALIWALALRNQRDKISVSDQYRSSLLYSSKWKILGYIALLLVIIQIFLGGWTSTNYAALACGSTFPTCQGLWFPEQDYSNAFNLTWQAGVNYEFGKLESAARTAINYTHRVMALVVFLFIGYFASKMLKFGLGNAPKFALAFLVIQITLGILNVVLSLPLSIAVAHTLFASLLLIAVLTMTYNLHTYQG